MLDMMKNEAGMAANPHANSWNVLKRGESFLHITSGVLIKGSKRKVEKNAKINPTAESANALVPVTNGTNMPIKPWINQKMIDIPWSGVPQKSPSRRMKGGLHAYSAGTWITS